MTMTDTAPQPQPGSGAAGLGATALLGGAIALGSVIGLLSPDLGQQLSAGTDPTLLLLVFLLFFEVRLRAVAAGFADTHFMVLAWGANFLIAPAVGFGMAWLFLSGQPLFYIGLVIYFMAPCTDWFLGFIRLARGDTALGAALIPVNMISQLLLFPLWLWLFAAQTGVVEFATIPDTLLQWFLAPFLLAQSLRLWLDRLLSQAVVERILQWVGRLIPTLIAVLVLQIFAANIGVIAAHLPVFGMALAAIFLFFVTMFLICEILASVAGLSYPQYVVLTITTAARNAPLMLAVTAAAIPDQPLILAALVIGMLVEFPHLTVLTRLLTKRACRKGEAA